jgi:DNA (cytosine-5)-methyltransferase 1
VTLRELHLFAGAGGGLLGSLLLGHRPVCAVEIDPYCRRVLAARRDEGLLPAELEIHDDVTTFDGHAWRGRVDLVAGGFPCQDISVAGKGAGLDGKRSGLFFELLRVVREVRPRWVYLENVPAITSRGLDRVLGALAELGFDAEWCVLSAADAGAPHLRKRWWCLARMVDADAGQRGGAEHALCAGRDAADHGRADVPDAISRKREQRHDGALLQRRVDKAEQARMGCSGCDVPDAASGQGDGQRRGELACASGARGCGDAAAGAGCQDDPDADSRRQQVGGSSALHRGSDALRRDADGLRKAGRGSWSDAADAHDAGRGEPRNAVAAPAQHAAAECGGGRAAERRLGGAADGMARWLDQTAAGYWAGDWETQPRLAQGQANRVARLRALGNGQVPQTAAMAFQILMQRYKDKP